VGPLVSILPYAIAAVIFVLIIVCYSRVIWRVSGELYLRARGMRVPGVVVGITWLNRAPERKRIRLRSRSPACPVSSP
jgi:hypothetical protein